MAKVFAPPKDLPFPEPDYENYDFDRVQQQEKEYIKKLTAWCRERYVGDCVGVVLRIGMADGHAVYMVLREKPLQLIHIPVGDSYRMDEVWERGLRLTDVNRDIKRAQEIAKLFSGETHIDD